MKYIVTRFEDGKREYLANSFSINNSISNECLFDRIGDAMAIAAEANDTIREYGRGDLYKVVSIENYGTIA